MKNIIENFKNALRSEDKSEKTIENYIKDIELFFKWIEETTGEDLKIEYINDFEIQQYRSYLLNVKKYKPSTVNRKLSSIKKFCRWALNQNLLREDPTKEIKNVRTNELDTAPKSLSKHDETKLRRYIHRWNNKRDIAIFELLINTGIRISELINLTIDDVEISERKGILRIIGKGSKYRIVPLNADARRYLKQYLKVRPKDRSRKLFISQKGGGLSRTSVFEMIKKYGELAGVNVHPHMLRHTFATKLVREGTDLSLVQSLLGHKTIQTTVRYTKPSEEEKQRAVESLIY